MASLPSFIPLFKPHTFPPVSNHTHFSSSSYNNIISTIYTTSTHFNFNFNFNFRFTTNKLQIMMMMMTTTTTTVRQIAVANSPISSLPRLSPSNQRYSRSQLVSKAQLSNQPSRSSRRYGNAIGNRKLNFSWMATVGENVKPTTPVTPTSVPVRVAHELHQAGHRYLDVRTAEEFCGGHAVGAINVPYLFKLGSAMTKNPDFVEEVLSHFGKDDEIIVGCQLGKRSLMAATDLLSAGFTGVTDIAGGYAAWNQNGLPIES